MTKKKPEVDKLKTAFANLGMVMNIKTTRHDPMVAKKQESVYVRK